MELKKAVELIKPAANRIVQIGKWADLGCGKGLFTRALAELLQAGSMIYAIDRNQKDLDTLKLPPQIHLRKLVTDFTLDVLPLSDLDGILMANSLHFAEDKMAIIEKSNQWLKSNGCFLLIEYNTDKPNAWVPYPISFLSATKIFQQSGYSKIKKLGTQPSLYNRADIYSALIER